MPSAMDKPACAKCGQRHWGFQPCSKGRPVETVHRPPEGFRIWGDRLETVYVYPPAPRKTTSDLPDAA